MIFIIKIKVKIKHKNKNNFINNTFIIETFQKPYITLQNLSKT